MEITIFIFQILILVCIGGIIFFRKYLFSYASEKGKNLATKEDVAEITKKVEEVKIQYVSEVEHLKMSLSIMSKKHSILFDEKICVFKKLQKALVDFKKYCECALGTFQDNGNEFHSALDDLDPNIPQTTLRHITLLREIEQEDFIFLSNKSKKTLSKLLDDCMIMCSMELTVYTHMDNEMIRNSAVPVYESAILKIDICLQDLFEELEFPEK